MNLVLLQNTEGAKLTICPVPDSLFSSRKGLEMFVRTHASRIFGIEGKDWRLCNGKPGWIVPFSVNEINRHTGDFGQQLVIE